MEASYLRRSAFRGRYLVRGSRGVYHLMSRTSCGNFLFDDAAKKMFIRMLHRQAGFCGIEVLAYCVMSNHFHLLVAVPEPYPISDPELLRRYRLLYDQHHCPPSSPPPDILAKLLQENSDHGRLLRQRILKRMHDLSAFMRELKQRFGIWFNRQHGNHGTIWARRYTSVIVEPTREALSTVAAYIDLNPVRAKIVSDPAEYPFSSYGRAMVGDRRARRGYEGVYDGLRSWRNLLPDYNLILYGKGYCHKGTVGKDTGTIDPEKVRLVLENKGKLPLSEVLRLRVRYFTGGTAIGSADFLKTVCEHWRDIHGIKRKRIAYPMRFAEWGKLQSYRNLQVKPIGHS